MTGAFVSRTIPFGAITGKMCPTAKERYNLQPAAEGMGAREDAEDRKEVWLWRTEPFAEASCQRLKQ